MDLREDILQCLNHGITKYRSLLNSLKTNKKELQALLDLMVREGIIYYDYDYNEYYIIKEAILNVKDRGYAFARVDDNTEYFIPPTEVGYCYDGDTVLVCPYEKGSKLINAKIIKVVKRAFNYVIGKLIAKRTKKGIKYYIESNIKAFPVKVNIREDQLNGAKPGEIVYADVTYQGTAINGKIKQILGHPDDPGIEISQIALEFGFEMDFSKETLNELESISEYVLEEQKNGRRDFTNKSVITIDGDDSKDFDDAVYLEILNNGNYLLEVYIADVSEYVKENSPLDIDAFKRGTSVYLADRVIPMLPRKLSNGICSLNEGVERLVLACIMEIDFKGNLVNYEIVEGIIKSKYRMTYNNVNKILLNDKELCEKYQDIVLMLNQMKELSNLIRQRRYKKGGIEFEVDEYKITLNEDGSPKDIILRERQDAERLIEDFMLQANETVAYHMNIMNIPCEYRVHEKPDQEKLHNVFGLISNMGIPLKNTKNDIHPKQIQEALEKINDNSFAPILNNMLLRSMMKAKYHDKCLGHYGLAMNYYCHFTSPIRRYPDLMVHRIIKRVLLHPTDFEKDILHFESILPEIALKNSLSERKAIECEREVNDMLYAWYLSNHINNEFMGIITSLTQFGMFVTLDNGIEGLVSYRDMNGYFEYNENTLSVAGDKRSYRLGDKVSVIVLSSNKNTRKIDFILKEDFESLYGEEYENNLF